MNVANITRVITVDSHDQDNRGTSCKNPPLYAYESNVKKVSLRFRSICLIGPAPGVTCVDNATAMRRFGHLQLLPPPCNFGHSKASEALNGPKFRFNLQPVSSSGRVLQLAPIIIYAAVPCPLFPPPALLAGFFFERLTT